MSTRAAFSRDLTIEWYWFYRWHCQTNDWETKLPKAILTYRNIETGAETIKHSLQSAMCRRYDVRKICMCRVWVECSTSSFHGIHRVDIFIYIWQLRRSSWHRQLWWWRTRVRLKCNSFVTSDVTVVWLLLYYLLDRRHMNSRKPIASLTSRRFVLKKKEIIFSSHKRHSTYVFHADLLLPSISIFASTVYTLNKNDK